MTGDKKSPFKVSDFYEEGSSFPDPESYPEEDECETYQAAGLTPESFETSDPEFGKRYAAWLKSRSKPADADEGP